MAKKPLPTLRNKKAITKKSLFYRSVKLGIRQATKKYGHKAIKKVCANPLMKELSSLLPDGQVVSSPSRSTLLQRFLRMRQERRARKLAAKSGKQKKKGAAGTSKDQNKTDEESEEPQTQASENSETQAPEDNTEEAKTEEMETNDEIPEPKDAGQSAAGTSTETADTQMRSDQPSTSRGVAAQVGTSDVSSVDETNTRKKRLQRASSPSKQDGREIGMNSQSSKGKDATGGNTGVDLPSKKKKKMDNTRGNVVSTLIQRDPTPVVSIKDPSRKVDPSGPESNRSNTSSPKDYRSTTVTAFPGDIREANPQPNPDIASKEQMNYLLCGPPQGCRYPTSIPGACEEAGGLMGVAEVSLGNLTKTETNGTSEEPRDAGAVAPKFDAKPHAKDTQERVSGLSNSVSPKGRDNTRCNEQLEPGQDRGGRNVIVQSWADGVTGFYTSPAADKSGPSGVVNADQAESGEISSNACHNDRPGNPSQEPNPTAKVPAATGETQESAAPTTSQPRSNQKKSSQRKKSKKGRVEKGEAGSRADQGIKKKAERPIRWRYVPPPNVIMTRRKSQDRNNMQEPQTPSLNPQSFDLFSQLPDSTQKRRKQEEDQTLLSDWQLDRYACALWSSDNRRHVHQLQLAAGSSRANTSATDDGGGGVSADELLRRAWDNLADPEKLRYMRRARSAVTDREKNRNGAPGRIAMAPLDLPFSLLNTVPADRALSMTLPDFKVLTLTQKDQVIGTRMRRIMSRVTMEQYETLLTFANNIFNSSSYADTGAFNMDPKKPDMENHLKDVLFEIMLVWEHCLAEKEERERAAREQALQSEYNRLLAQLICEAPQGSQIADQAASHWNWSGFSPELKDAIEALEKEAFGEQAGSSPGNSPGSNAAVSCQIDGSTVENPSTKVSSGVSMASTMTTACDREIDQLHYIQQNGSKAPDNHPPRSAPSSNQHAHGMRYQATRNHKQVPGFEPLEEYSEIDCVDQAYHRIPELKTMFSAKGPAGLDCYLRNVVAAVPPGESQHHYQSPFSGTFSSVGIPPVQAPQQYSRDTQSVGDRPGTSYSTLTNAAENKSVANRPTQSMQNLGWLPNQQSVARHHAPSYHGMMNPNAGSQNLFSQSFQSPNFYGANTQQRAPVTNRCVPPYGPGMIPFGKPELLRSGAEETRYMTMNLSGDRWMIPIPDEPQAEATLQESYYTPVEQFLDGDQMKQILQEEDGRSSEVSEKLLEAGQALPYSFQVGDAMVQGPTNFLNNLLLEDMNTKEARVEPNRYPPLSKKGRRKPKTKEK